MRKLLAIAFCSLPLALSPTVYANSSGAQGGSSVGSGADTTSGASSGATSGQSGATSSNNDSRTTSPSDTRRSGTTDAHDGSNLGDSNRDHTAAGDSRLNDDPDTSTPSGVNPDSPPAPHTSEPAKQNRGNQP